MQGLVALLLKEIDELLLGVALHHQIEIERRPLNPVRQQRIAPDRGETVPALAEECRQTADYGGYIHSPSLTASGYRPSRSRWVGDSPP